MSSVNELAENSKLDHTLFEKLDKELSFLADYFHVTKPQALFLSVIISLNYKRGTVDFGNLDSHFNSGTLKLLEYIDDFEELCQRRLLRKKDKGIRLGSVGIPEFDNGYVVNEIVTNKIFKNEEIPLTLVDNHQYKDVFTLLEKIYDLADKRDNGEISTRELFDQAESIMKENTHFPLIKKSRLISPRTEVKFLFYLMVWYRVTSQNNVWISSTFSKIYDRPNEQFIELQWFLSGKNILIRGNWLEIERATFFDDAKMKLTDKALDFLVECDLQLLERNFEKKDNIILPGDIPFKKLVFNDGEMHQLDLLKNLLQEKNFKTTQKRLTENALPKGVVALLHGVPGTGKTESVLQISKATNRQIMKVDISATRSMWLGESEKLMKQVFKDYSKYAKTLKTKPILFFNEADAIIAKRKESHSSAVSDTENRIQNILLEEFENFDGILIATTNLVNNMDTAFERRFLFKIKFEKPNLNAKAQIWKSKMPKLSKNNCELLASRFDFSGGQIDNIVRKSAINEVIHGKKTDIEMLLKFCKEETLGERKLGKAIGFGKKG